MTDDMQAEDNPFITRVESEANFTWAQNHPELFVRFVMRFQKRYPVDKWAHRIDLSREHYITLIATRTGV